MDYVLDTNACIALLPGHRHPVLTNLLRRQAEQSRIYVSSVVLFELHYGIVKSKRKQENKLRIERLLGLGIETAEFTSDDGYAAAHRFAWPSKPANSP